ncbi:MAG: hypothetical protein ABI746_09350 [Dermatophilaceae bacterium]
MRGRLSFLVGAAAGYVLGARAGRVRYDQLKSQADQLWHDPRVQDKVASAQTRVAATAREVAPDIRAKLSDSAGAAKAAMTQAAPSGDPADGAQAVHAPAQPPPRRVRPMSNDNEPLSRPRAELLPEEIAAGSDDHMAQVNAINDDSNERAVSESKRDEFIARSAEEATGGATSAK